MGKKIYTRDVIDEKYRALLDAKPKPKAQRSITTPAPQEPKR